MNKHRTSARRTGVAALLSSSALVAATLAVSPATADEQAPTPRQAAKAQKNGTVLGVYDHLFRLQEIADRNGGNRASGLRGYAVSRDYIVRQLKQSGYKPKVQDFEFPFFQQTGPSTFTVDGTELVEDEDYTLMTYSASGDVTGALTGVDLQLTTPNTSTSGCEAEDFADFPEGDIALIQRGSCAFGVKVSNAEAAGAVAAIVMNSGATAEPDTQDLFAGTLGEPVGIPAISVSYPTGQELATGNPEGSLTTETDSRIATTWNVIASTKKGRANNIVMAGAHLDSVPEGAGINDNGSGSAALLETAQAIADLPKRQARKQKNKVRFAWWGAEELGLLGAEHYVAQLAENRPKKFQDIALYLNFDMVGSPNYSFGVYDGNGDSSSPDLPPAPEGSAAIEQLYHRFFDKAGTGSVDTEFSGRSDYGPFIALNVPAGGLFTGAEGIKTEEEAELFGGQAGEAYDPNYHEAGDDIDNVSYRALKTNTAAILHSVKRYSRSTKSVNGNSTGHQPPADTAKPSARDGQGGHGHGHDHNDVVAR